MLLVAVTMAVGPGADKHTLWILHSSQPEINHDREKESRHGQGNIAQGQITEGKEFLRVDGQAR